MKEKSKRKLNIVDVVVIALILAAAVFFGVRMLRDSKPMEERVKRPGVIRFTVEVDGLRKDLYEGIASRLPTQMAASGKLVDGWILDTWSEDVVVERILAKSPVNASREEELLPEEGVEYVNAYFLCEADVDLNDNLNLTGTQELRLGRSYYVKSVDIEVNGTIISMEKRDAPQTAEGHEKG